jgi:HK97 family phage prohead protease
MAGKCGIKTQCYIDSNGIDSDKKTVAVVLSDETPMERYDYETGEIYTLVLQHTEESIDLSRKDVMSVFWAHNDYSLPIGIHENVRLEDGKLKSVAHLDEDDKFAMQVFGKVEKGILKTLSVGVDILEKKITRDENNKMTVLVTKWRPFEGSFTGNPANENAKVGLSKQNQHKEESMEVQMNDVKIFLAAKATDDDKAVLLRALGGVPSDNMIQLKASHATAIADKDTEHQVLLSGFGSAVLDAVGMMTDKTFENVSDDDKKVALSKVTLSKDGKFDGEKLELEFLRLAKTNSEPSGEQPSNSDDVDKYAKYENNDMKNL